MKKFKLSCSLIQLQNHPIDDSVWHVYAPVGEGSCWPEVDLIVFNDEIYTEKEYSYLVEEVVE